MILKIQYYLSSQYKYHFIFDKPSNEKKSQLLD